MPDLFVFVIETEGGHSVTSRVRDCRVVRESAFVCCASTFAMLQVARVECYTSLNSTKSISTSASRPSFATPTVVREGMVAMSA